MPLPLLLAAAAVPAIFKGIQGISQAIQADHVKLRDTTPPAFKEALGLGRQAAAAGMPGEGQQLNRLDEGTNSTLAAATRAGTSSSSILGLLSSADANRTRALADLNTRADAYHQQQQRGLSGLLQQQAGYQKADSQEYDRSKAALKEASQRNIYGALEDGSQVAAYGLNKADAGTTGEGGLNSELIKKAGKRLAAADGSIVSGPDDIYNRRRNIFNYGVPDYSGYSLGDIG